MKSKKRIFVATTNLYLYPDEDGWSADNPSEYGRDYGMSAKEVREDLLFDEIRKGTKFYLKNTDDDDLIDCEAYPYCLRSIRGKHVVGYETIGDVESDPAFMEVRP